MEVAISKEQPHLRWLGQSCTPGGHREQRQVHGTGWVSSAPISLALILLTS